MKPLHVFGILGAGVVLFGLLSLSITPDDPPPPAPPPPAVRALPDAEYLANLQHSGGAAAMAAYEGRRLIVRGRYLKTLTFEGNPVILLDAGPGTQMPCMLVGKDRVSLAHLKYGDLVYISGENLTARLLNFAGGCRLATRAEVEAAKAGGQ